MTTTRSALATGGTSGRGAAPQERQSDDSVGDVVDRKA
jgi:hypothetical protein